MRYDYVFSLSPTFFILCVVKLGRCMRMCVCVSSMFRWVSEMCDIRCYQIYSDCMWSALVFDIREICDYFVWLRRLERRQNGIIFLIDVRTNDELKANHHPFSMPCIFADLMIQPYFVRLSLKVCKSAYRRFYYISETRWNVFHSISRKAFRFNATGAHIKDKKFAVSLGVCARAVNENILANTKKKCGRTGASSSSVLCSSLLLVHCCRHPLAPAVALIIMSFFVLILFSIICFCFPRGCCCYSHRKF